MTVHHPRERRILASRIVASRILASMALAALVTACGPGRNEFAPVCPVPELVRSLTDLVRYQNGIADAAHLIISARIIDIRGKCEPGGRDKVRATARVVIDVTRGPAMPGLAYVLPVFVAVTEAGQVEAKSEYALAVEFSKTGAAARAVSPEIDLALPVPAGKSGAAYRIVAGFQLTPEEVAANRRKAGR